MIDIAGKYYKIDIDALMAWVSETPTSEKNTSTITTLTYPITEEEDDVVEKEISENKSTLNDTMNNIRYDLIRNIINVLFSLSTNETDGTPIFSLKDLSFAQKITFNTLLSKKIIIEIGQNYE